MASTNRITLPIDGMTCAGCVSTVESALKQVPGINYVSVNLATEKATVETEHQQVDIPAILRAVKTAGYSAPVEQHEIAIAGSPYPGWESKLQEALSNMAGVASVEISADIGASDGEPYHRESIGAVHLWRRDSGRLPSGPG